MKLVRILVILLSLGVFFFTSCRKAHLSSNNQNSNSSDTSGTLLKEIIQLDTLVTTGHDTAYKIMYNYDSLKRLADCTLYTYDSSNGNILSASIDTILYDGDNINPYRAVSFSGPLEGSNVGEVTEVNTFFYYDSDGQINLKKSFTSGAITPEPDSVITFYNNSGGNIISTTNSYNHPYIFIDTVSFRSTGGNNITTGEYTVYAGESTYDGQISDAPEEHDTYTDILYDTHKNPFTSVAKYLYLGLTGTPIPTGYFGGPFKISTNNVMSYSASQSFYSNAPALLPYNARSFVYNDNDYPVSSRYSTYGLIGAGIGPIAGINYFYYYK